MKLVPNSQHWVLVGTAPASEKVWGLRHIAFPCAYYMPACAFANIGQPVIRPVQGKEIWAIGGFAFEVKKGGKAIKKESAAGLVKGYRPWLALFHNVLVDELNERKHTIQIWDHGVSIFYGLWHEASQTLGDLILMEDSRSLVNQPVALETETNKRVGSPAREYAHSAIDVVAFMSSFMTLSDGDIYVLGPLVAQRIAPDVEHVLMSVENLRLEVLIG